MIAVICAIVLLATGTGLRTDIARLGAGAALGGAAGNLFDILRRRSVTDFIDLGWWPVFNIADVAIVAGLALAFVPLT
jgi:signal peptidase II